MVNGFFRPGDLKFMQHKPIDNIEGKHNYLRLTLPETKKHGQPIVTMPAAVGIYRRLLADAKARGYGKPNDYLFMPAITFRLLYGQGVDLLTLAKNARTSIEMIERHYASTLNGEMNIGLLHSKRTRKPQETTQSG